MKSLRRTLAVGYVVIVALIGGIICTYLYEWRQIDKLEKESRQIHLVRQKVHNAYVQMMDLTFYGETILQWSEDDTAIYRSKRLAMDSLLCEFKEYYPGERIDSLRIMLQDKEHLLFNIFGLYQEQDSLTEQLVQKVPQIAYQSSQKPEKKGGFLGLFKKKETVTTTSSMLYTLNRDVVTKQQEQQKELSANVDTLSSRNTIVNNQVQAMIKVLNARVQEDLQHREDVLSKSRDKSYIIIVFLTAFVIILLIVSYLIISRDYRQKELGRRKLEEINRQNQELLDMRNNIILTISHDIRGPLNAINGSAELAMDTKEKKKRNTYLSNIHDRCKHILSLLNNLLDVYRLNEAKETINEVPFNLSEMLERITSDFVPMVNDKGLRFIYETKGTDVTVKGDRDCIERIIDNLLGNALKFTKHGSISFIAEHNNETLNLEISDTGVGMDEKMLERLFVPFERATNGADADGFGLGMPITKGLITMLGGTISVQSTVGNGATFNISLPLPISNEQPESVVETVVDLTLPKSVIVIDDDPMQCTILKEMLERNGISCMACKDAAELMKVLRTGDHDLIISDIQMPGTNGYQLLELLRNSNVGNSRTIPVVAMTARGDTEREKLLQYGFKECIFKPFSMNELLYILSTITERSKSEMDFSALTSEVSDKVGILESLIESCEKAIKDINVALPMCDRALMRETVHTMKPIWEMLHIGESLQEYHDLLKNDEADEKLIVTKSKEFIAQMENVIGNAKLEIERIANEEKDTDC